MYLLALEPEGSSARLPSVVLLGQPPIMEWMTIHLEVLVGALSVVSATWQEPPPWTALPVKERVWGAPIGMVFAVAGGGEVIPLHGKSLPSASRGEEFGEPKGAGVFMIMWPDTDPAEMAAATRAEEKCML